MSELRCVAPGCGLTFEGQEAKVDPKDGRPLGRTETSAGPMHFGCYWRFCHNAERAALASIEQPATAGRKE